MAGTPEERIERLEREVGRLRAEVQRLQSTAPTPVPPSHSAPRAWEVVPGPDGPPGPADAGPAPAAYPGVAPSPAAPPASDARVDWESRLGSRWLAVAGIVLAVLAAAFFLTLAIERGWISPLVQLLLIAAIGVLLWALGAYLAASARLGHFAHVLAAGGVAITAFTVFAAHHIEMYRQATGIGLELDSVLLAVVAVAALADAGLRRAEAQAATAATLVPLTAFFAEAWTVFSLAYPLVMAAAVLGAAVWRRWHIVPLFVVPGVLAVLAVHIDDGIAPAAVTAAALALVAMVTAAGLRAPREAEHAVLAAIAQALAWLGTWAVLLWAVGEWDVPLRAWVTLALGLAAGALALWAPVAPRVRIGWAAAAVPALILWVPLLEWAWPVPYLWAAMLVAAAWASTRWRAPWMPWVALVLGCLLTLRLLAEHAQAVAGRDHMYVVDAGAFLVGAAALAGAWWLARTMRGTHSVAPRLLLGLAPIALFALAAALWNGPVVSLAWAAVGAAALAAGFATDQLDLRIAGLGAFAVTLGRIVVVDLAGVDPVWRVLALGGVAALLLVASYLYVRRMRGGARKAPTVGGPAGAAAEEDLRP